MSSMINRPLLNPAAMASGQALAQAFRQAAQQAPLASLPQLLPRRDEAAQVTSSPRVIIADDLWQIALQLKRLGGDTGYELTRLADSFANVGIGREGIEEQIQRLLEGLSDPTLVMIRQALAVEAAPAAETAVAPAAAVAEGGLAIVVAGVPFVPPTVGPAGFGRIEEAGQRVPVSSPPAEQERARANLKVAVERYLKGLYLPEHLVHLERHLDGILSGEIDAPLGLRDGVVGFLAMGPGHAATYAEKLLADAVLAGQIQGDLLTVIPDVATLEPKWLAPPPPPPEEEAPPRASQAVGDAPGLSSLLYALRVGNVREFEALAAINPEAYGSGALRRLDTVASVLTQAVSMEDPKDRLEYLAMAETTGILPPGYLTSKTDPRKVTVAFEADPPRGRPEDVPRDLITQYLASTEFRDDLLEIPIPSEDYPMAGKIDDLLRSPDPQGRLLDQDLRRLVDLKELARRDREAARAGFLRLRLSLLQGPIRRLQAQGLVGLASLNDRIAYFLREKSYAEAEAVLDFARQWSGRAEDVLARMEEVQVTLRLQCEKAALAEFSRLSGRLIERGNLDALIALVAHVHLQTAGGEIRLRDQLATLHKRVNGALTVIVESARVIGAIPSQGERTRFATQIPSVDQLLVQGPLGEEAARSFLRSLGLPLPGDANVLALGTPQVRGLLPGGAAPGRMLPGEPPVKADGS